MCSVSSPFWHLSGTCTCLAPVDWFRHLADIYVYWSSSCISQKIFPHKCIGKPLNSMVLSGQKTKYQLQKDGDFLYLEAYNIQLSSTITVTDITFAIVMFIKCYEWAIHCCPSTSLSCLPEAVISMQTTGLIELSVLALWVFCTALQTLLKAGYLTLTPAIDDSLCDLCKLVTATVQWRLQELRELITGILHCNFWCYFWWFPALSSAVGLSADSCLWAQSFSSICWSSATRWCRFSFSLTAHRLCTFNDIQVQTLTRCRCRSRCRCWNTCSEFKLEGFSDPALSGAD